MGAPVVAVGELDVEVLVDRHDGCAGWHIEATEHPRMARGLENLRLVGAGAGEPNSWYFGHSRDVVVMRRNERTAGNVDELGQLHLEVAPMGFGESPGAIRNR